MSGLERTDSDGTGDSGSGHCPMPGSTGDSSVESSDSDVRITDEVPAEVQVIKSVIVLPTTNQMYDVKVKATNNVFSADSSSENEIQTVAEVASANTSRQSQDCVNASVTVAGSVSGFDPARPSSQPTGDLINQSFSLPQAFPELLVPQSSHHQSSAQSSSDALPWNLETVQVESEFESLPWNTPANSFTPIPMEIEQFDSDNLYKDLTKASGPVPLVYCHQSVRSGPQAAITHSSTTVSVCSSSRMSAQEQSLTTLPVPNMSGHQILEQSNQSKLQQTTSAGMQQQCLHGTQRFVSNESSSGPPGQCKQSADGTQQFEEPVKTILSEMICLAIQSENFLSQLEKCTIKPDCKIMETAMENLIIISLGMASYLYANGRDNAELTSGTPRAVQNTGTADPTFKSYDPLVTSVPPDTSVSQQQSVDASQRAHRPRANQQEHGGNSQALGSDRLFRVIQQNLWVSSDSNSQELPVVEPLNLLSVFNATTCRREQTERRVF